ncbi:hypothetical protein J7K50_08420 [bacterium]|nr:hypothetical protein [bacterium]
MPKKLTEEMHRIPAAFTRDMMEWLAELSRDAKFTGGSALRTTQILRALVRAGMWVGIDVKGVRSEDELFERIKAGILKKKR